MGANYVLKVLVSAVAEMRSDQRIYFLSRSPADLRKAIKSEAKVDKVLGLVDKGVVSLTDVHGNEFDVRSHGDEWVIVDRFVDVNFLIIGKEGDFEEGFST